MKRMKKTGGFTLIELLVVIAIIGILSSVVLVSLNSARQKGGDAAVQSNLSTIQTQSEIYSSNNNNAYGPSPAITGSGVGTAAGTCGSVMTGTIFSDGTIINAINGANTNGNGGVLCVASSTAYAIEAKLKTSQTYWCVDSNGYSGTTSASVGATTLCK